MSKQRAALHPAFGFEEQRPADGAQPATPNPRAAAGTQECDLEIVIKCNSELKKMDEETSTRNEAGQHLCPSSVF